MAENDPIALVYASPSRVGNGRLVAIGVIGIIVAIVRFLFHAVLLFGAIAMRLYSGESDLSVPIYAACGIVFDMLLFSGSIAAAAQTQWSAGFVARVSMLDLVLAIIVSLGWVVGWLSLAASGLSQFADRLGLFAVLLGVCAVQSIVWWLVCRQLARRNTVTAA